jgi:hypothetical protein
MANTILTATAVTREALRVLHQKLNFVGSITRDYDDRFAKAGAKIGDTLKVRLPNQYSVRTGATIDVNNTVEDSVELKVQTQKGVDLNFSSDELTMDMDDFSERVLEPAMSVLAANIEADALSMYKDVYNQVNNTGSAATTAVLGEGRKKLVDNLAPGNGRVLQLNTQDNLDLVEAMKALFHRGETISKQQREGMVGSTVSFGDVYENTLLVPHARGAADADYDVDTTAINNASETAVTSLAFITGTGTKLQGDIFTVATIYRVHPESKVSTGALQQFVVTANAASGANSVSISPSIITAGPKQNVTIVGASATAAVTFAGTASASHGISLAYQKGAFAFATADLVMPKGVDFSAREVFDGISMRIVRQYDINNDKFPCRLDVLYGYKTLRAQLATRLANR